MTTRNQVCGVSEQNEVHRAEEPEARLPTPREEPTDFMIVITAKQRRREKKNQLATTDSDSCAMLAAELLPLAMSDQVAHLPSNVVPGRAASKFKCATSTSGPLPNHSRDGPYTSEEEADSDASTVAPDGAEEAGVVHSDPANANAVTGIQMDDALNSTSVGDMKSQRGGAHEHTDHFAEVQLASTCSDALCRSPRCAATLDSLCASTIEVQRPGEPCTLENGLFTVARGAEVEPIRRLFHAKAGKYPIGIWKVCNGQLTNQFLAYSKALSERLGKPPRIVRGWHGTPEKNIVSVAQQGFDPRCRSKQAMGDGEYFALSPKTSMDYCNGGAFLFLCHLVLGSDVDDHTVIGNHCIVTRQLGQAMPVYLVQFKVSESSLASQLPR